MFVSVLMVVEHLGLIVSNAQWLTLVYKLTVFATLQSHNGGKFAFFQTHSLTRKYITESFTNFILNYAQKIDINPFLTEFVSQISPTLNLEVPIVSVRGIRIKVLIWPVYTV